MERLLPLLEEPLHLVRYVRRCPPGAALDAAQLRALFRGALARMRKAGEHAGFSTRDLDAIGFAVVALIDEVVLARGGALAYEWMREQLQLSLFGENTAGETFFAHLEELRRDRSRAEVLAAYYLVLTLGFRGRYAVQGELALDELIASVRGELVRAGALVESPLAPSASRPRDAITRRSDGRVVLGIGVLAAALAAVVYAGLWTDLAMQLGQVLPG